MSVLGVDFGVFEVLATNGASRLGGLDYDHRLMTYLLSLPNTPQDAKFRYLRNYLRFLGVHAIVASV